MGITPSTIGISEKAYACSRIYISLHNCGRKMSYVAGRIDVVSYHTFAEYQVAQQ